jgi:hypothetical protein
VVGNSDRESESDLRRRAAWLLAMLAVVAILLVVVMSQLMNSDGGGSGKSGPAALDSEVGRSPSSTSARPAKSTPVRSRSSSAPASSTTSTSGNRTSCPTTQTCILDGDPGNGIVAINLYRSQHGQDAVAGRVSAKAQQCALANGSGCSGGWAETELAKPDGAAAVQKILPFAHLLDPMSGFDVGWAYDPGAKLYYFAVIRHQ